MREILEREQRIRGEHNQELMSLKAQFFDKVLPRYLRPLESEGRSVTPCLVHADLWPGNCRYRLNMETVCIYDACAFWGHNEGMYLYFSLSCRLWPEISTFHTDPLGWSCCINV